ncbi:MAG TPA: DUF896 family protein [Clostridiales bacterium]|nr:DUF896 family protein [Clostridiales bacterium]
MEKTKLDRINELAKKAKTTGLTNEEKQEQQELRQEYIMGFRNSLTSTLDNTVLMDEKGNKRKLERKNNKKLH